jgi:hypothetical protein
MEGVEVVINERRAQDGVCQNFPRVNQGAPVAQDKVAPPGMPHLDRASNTTMGQPRGALFIGLGLRPW